ncbi:hypothetical protein ABMA28_016537 [Loxostege sticticalis]|uniref:THAP-type domain-containing protein n=1 Tax=Loxostege sticticalis TaxID=481309 RepID=A0ABD0T961_LOXSC
MISTNLHEKYSNYRYCIVRDCKNTSIKTQGTLWITVPSETNIRKAWLRLAERDPESLSTVTQIYFCEDHFDTWPAHCHFSLLILWAMYYSTLGYMKKCQSTQNVIEQRYEIIIGLNFKCQ